MNVDEARQELKLHFEETKRLGQIASHVLIKHAASFRAVNLVHNITVEEHLSVRLSGFPEKSGHLAAVFSHLRERDVLLIEEIHRLSEPVLAMLVDTMAAFTINIVVGQGYSKKEVTLSLPRFTMIGATSQPWLLSDTLSRSFHKHIWVDDDDKSPLSEPQLTT